MNSTLCSKTWDGWRIPTKSWDEDFKFFGMKGSKSLRWRVQKASKALFKDFGWGVQSRWDEGLNNWFKDLGWTGFWNDESSKALFNYIYIYTWDEGFKVVGMKGSKDFSMTWDESFKSLGSNRVKTFDQRLWIKGSTSLRRRVQSLWDEGLYINLLGWRRRQKLWSKTWDEGFNDFGNKKGMKAICPY